MNISVTFDKNYQKWAAVCLNSIVINTSTKKIKLFIFTDLHESDFCAQLKNVLNNFDYVVEKLGSDFDNLPTGYHFSKAMYGLLAMPRILHKMGQKKVLYLDLDTLIIKDLNNLYSLNLDDYYCAGALDINSNDVMLQNRLALSQGFVVNSGVLLMNIEQMSKIDWIYQSNELNRKGMIKWGDQDIINILLDGKIKIVDQKWNVQSGHFQNSYDGEVNILHFTESGNTKPWTLGTKHRHLNTYNTYMRKTGFYKEYIIYDGFRRLKKIFNIR